MSDGSKTLSEANDAISTGDDASQLTNALKAIADQRREISTLQSQLAEQGKKHDEAREYLDAQDKQIAQLSSQVAILSQQVKELTLGVAPTKTLLPNGTDHTKEIFEIRSQIVELLQVKAQVSGLQTVVQTAFQAISMGAALAIPPEKQRRL